MVHVMYSHMVIAFCLFAGNTLLSIMLKHSKGNPSVALSILLVSMFQGRALLLPSSAICLAFFNDISTNSSDRM